MLVNISTFSPTTLDDRKIVQLKKTVIHGNTKKSQETWIVLCRKKSESEAVVTNNRILLFRILVAGGVLTLLILILVAVWLVIRMKYNKPKEECSDNYYGNLSNEDSSGPFPRQWDTYANTMVESDQGTSVQDLYTKPVPKSLRQGKLGLNKPNDTYTNVPIHPAEEELYSDVGGYANPVRK